MVPVHIPKLGFSMTEGTVAQWLVDDGDLVAEGQVIYTMATDKVETDVEAPAAGRIRVIAAEDTAYPVGELVAEIRPESV